MIVLGSSLGWQAMFAALMYGISVDGYELVQYRHEAALEFSKRHQVTVVQLRGMC